MNRLAEQSALRHHKAHRKVGFVHSRGFTTHRVIVGSMIFFYVDEAGDPNPFHNPLLAGETPLFCLSAVAIESTQWRELDRALLGLKRTYFVPELARFRAANPDLRDRHFEVKGRDLVKPSNVKNRRTRNFAGHVLRLAETLSARLFCVAWVKQPNPGDPMAIYTHSLQILAERFHHYARSQKTDGVLVVDARTRNLDFRVGDGLLSYLFGNNVGRTYTELAEAPMFADSRLSAGIQFADLLGGCLYGYYYQKKCGNIPGLFDGQNAVTPEQFDAKPVGWWGRTPARDYAYSRSYWPQLESLQFRRADVPPPVMGGPIVPGYYGFREIDGRPAPVTGASAAP